MRNSFLVLILLSSASLSLCRPAPAALVAYTDYAMYQAALAAAGATEDIVDFDSLGSGATIGTFGGITFSATDANSNPVTLNALETDPVVSIFNPVPSDTISPLNFVGRFPRPVDFSTTLEDETVMMSFSAKSAFGLFAIAPNSNNISLTVDGTMVNAGAADPAVIAGPNSAYFIGVIDDGGGTFTEAELGGNNAGYYFDSITSSTITAIPEPSTAFAVGMILTFGLTRRRRT